MARTPARRSAVTLDAGGRYGPKMQRLTDKQRRFVIYIAETGTTNETEAAEAAGYSEGGSYQALRVTAHRLSSDPKIQEAIQEEVRRRFFLLAPRALANTVRIADTEGHKDEFNANKHLLNLAGLAAVEKHEHKHEHTDASVDALVEEIQRLAKKYNLDATGLIGDRGKTVDLGPDEFSSDDEEV